MSEEVLTKNFSISARDKTHCTRHWEIMRARVVPALVVVVWEWWVRVWPIARDSNEPFTTVSRAWLSQARPKGGSGSGTHGATSAKLKLEITENDMMARVVSSGHAGSRRLHISGVMEKRAISSRRICEINPFLLPTLLIQWAAHLHKDAGKDDFLHLPTTRCLSGVAIGCGDRNQCESWLEGRLALLWVHVRWFDCSM